MREFQELRKTTNRSVYNKLYKKELDKRGKIKCSLDGYHRGENDDSKYYGVSWMEASQDPKPRYPSWKLTSKNRKQWMKKRLKIKKRSFKCWHQVKITW